MNLVIVESPTKARKLKSYLGSNYQVEASVGHVRDLPKKTLGIDVEKNFEPVYEVSADKKKVVNQLKKLAANSEKIYLAMDPDREGEAIAWHLQALLSDSKSKTSPKKAFLRSTFNQITKEAVTDAINNPGEVNINLVDAQQARRVMDRLVGYKVSPVLWKKIKRGLSAGRVQSVALRMISEREKEINAFVAEEFWEVDVALNQEKLKDIKSKTIFKNGKQIENIPDEILVVSLDKVNGKKVTKDEKSCLRKSEDAVPVVEDLRIAEYKVVDVVKKERTRQSLPAFTTSTLQQSASTRYGFSAKQTMALAQQLYEEGLITYHRTDSVNLATSAIEMARGYVSQKFGAEYLPEKPRYFASKSKNAQEAHEAIRVTDANLSADQIISKSSQFTDRHAKLYDLIWRRFLASQMASAIYDQTSIEVEAVGSKKNKYILKASGSIQRFDGWTKLFSNSEDKILPNLSKNQNLYFTDINPLQKFTQPPARYNDASLIKELEKKGIGRPSTYASIISVIVARGYVERTDKKFFATPVGMTVSDFLIDHFEKLMDYDFTASMEEDLDEISLGKKQWQKVVGDFYKPLAKTISKVIDSAERAQVPVEKTGVECPDCVIKNKAGELADDQVGEIVLRSGRFGKFKSCSRYPECKFTENIVNKLGEQLCPLCGKGDVIMRNTRWGKMFYGCGNYPKCDWASWQKPDPEYKLSKEEWVVMQTARKEKMEKRKATMDAKKGEKAVVKKKVVKKKVEKKAVAKKKTVKKKSIKKTVKK